MHEFWDRIGITTSILCMIHCLFTPALIAIAPFVGATLESHWVHPVIIAIAIPVAVWALWSGYKHHRHISTIYLGGAGIACIIMGMLSGFQNDFDHNSTEIAFMVAAGLFLGTAHYKNLTACTHKH